MSARLEAALRPPEAGTPHTRKEQLIELSVFLLLILPSMLLSLFVVRGGGISFDLTAWAVILRDLGLVALIMLFLRRNGEPVARIGWTREKGWREALLGIALFVPLFIGTRLLEAALLNGGLHGPSAPAPLLQAAGGPLQSMLGVILVAVVAVAEETIFRGYLILRFRSLTSSPVAALLISSVIFSIGHGYEGSAGVVTVGAMGAVFALVYLWRGSLIAPVTMHFLQDFIGVVALPLIMHHL